MNWLYPRIPRNTAWRALLIIPLLGSLIAGAYGVIHDQITYTIAPEYFTKFKLVYQFDWVLRGQSERLAVAEVGWLASWWVGLIAGWLIARLSIKPDGSLPPISTTMKSFGVIIGFAVLSGIMGWCYGFYYDASGTLPTYWWIYKGELELTDLASFARVGYIHNFSYTGAAIGLVVEGVRVWRRKTEKYHQKNDPKS